MAKCLVTGSSGFIAGHLIERLVADGHEVHGVDIRDPEFRSDKELGYDWLPIDLRHSDEAYSAFRYFKPEWVFALAADMGGMGFISNNDEQILTNNLAINLNSYNAAQSISSVEKYFFSSSVCVYPEQMQMDDNFQESMHEAMAYPADPQDAYGWEKLTTERLLQAAHHDRGFPTYIARFHNCYGPYCAWKGGREKAPAALCRKFAEADVRFANADLHQDMPYEIKVWGDGQQIRPFVYVTDLVDGILRLIKTDYHDPVNIGPTWNAYDISEHIMTIEYLTHIIANTLGLRGDEWYINNVPGPEGVRYRGAEGGLMETLTGWRPTTTVRDGISKLYPWIEEQVLRARR